MCYKNGGLNDLQEVEIKVEGYQETADLYTYILDNSVEMRPDRSARSL